MKDTPQIVCLHKETEPMIILHWCQILWDHSTDYFGCEWDLSSICSEQIFEVQEEIDRHYIVLSIKKKLPVVNKTANMK